MSPRPVIFISAVSRELGSARQLVANTLTFLGYDPEWQDIFGTEVGDLRTMLRRRIDNSKVVEQLANQQQQQTNQQLQTLQGEFDKLQQGVNNFAEVQNKVRQEQPGQKPEELERRTYEELGKRLGLDAATLKEQLPRFAEELKKAPNASTYERANAAYVSKDYNEAERLALAAADEAQRSGPAKNAEAIKAFELAGWAAEKRIEYADALKRLRVAEALTDLTRDPVEWARVQFAIAYILDDQGQYSVAESILRKVLEERERALGPEHPDTLKTP